MSQTKIAICRHIKTDGHRCQSPAQNPSAFCYHHRDVRRTPKRRPSQPSESSAILRTMEIITRKASGGGIQPHDANLMLRALEYASRLSTTQAESRS